uniref:Histone domain-containing protein n=1 Tax=Parastrongyloides trichosuri TaxID=131310 RepID=A0A0N5A161_PARTI
MAKKRKKKNTKTQGLSKKTNTSKVSKKGPVAKSVAKSLVAGSDQVTSKHKNRIRSEVPAKMAFGNPNKQSRAVWKLSSQLFVQIGCGSTGQDILEGFKPTRLSKVRFDVVRFIDSLTKAAVTVVHIVSYVRNRLKAVAKALESNNGY